MIDAATNLRFRSVAHLSEQEVVELLEQIAREPRRSQLMGERPEARALPQVGINPGGLAGLGSVKIPTLSIIPANRIHDVKIDTKRTENGSRDESFIKNYARKSGPSNMKEEFTSLWYEKLALEEAVDKLVV